MTLGNGNGDESWRSSEAGNAAASLSRSWSRGDDEHGLIARYASKLAQGHGPKTQTETASGAQQLLAQLEAKNQEILREIARIRLVDNLVNKNDCPPRF